MHLLPPPPRTPGPLSLFRVGHFPGRGGSIRTERWSRYQLWRVLDAKRFEIITDRRSAGHRCDRARGMQIVEGQPRFRVITHTADALH